MTTSIDLMTSTMDYINEHPDELHQSGWSRCFAGHTVRIAQEQSIVVPEIVQRPEACPCTYCTTGNGPTAQALLGLQNAQADALFHAGNDIPRLRVLVAEFQTTVPARELVNA